MKKVKTTIPKEKDNSKLIIILEEKKAFTKKKIRLIRNKKINLFKSLFKKRILITIILILSIFIILFSLNKIKRNINKELINKEKDSIRYAIYNTSNLKNVGFLYINTTHKGKYTNYDYKSNIKVYKDLYNNNDYVTITESNSILNYTQLSKNEYSELCENGTLLDNTKYKRNKNPKISVVIPYFNKNFLSPRMLLRSIQNQSLKDVEIIFVDDGSYEESIKELLDFMKEDNRIILLRHLERKTTLLTRIDGIRYASGEYIIQIDQDDMYLNNLLFEKLYKKAKELNLDIIQFLHCSNDNPKVCITGGVSIPRNIVIKQPELKTAFFSHYGNNGLGGIKSRMIWNKFVRRIPYVEAIEDLGDEYMNHKYRCYEDTIMMFQISQIANSYYYYDIEGYRHCTFNSGKIKEKNETIEKELWTMNQLLFIKLLIHKIDPKYDRAFLNREFGFGSCTKDAPYLNRDDLDLGLEVIEGVFELERIYNNTDRSVLDCANQILEIWKKKFDNIN